MDSILFMCDKTLEDFIGHDAYKFYTAPTERPSTIREQKNATVGFDPRDYGDIKRTKSTNELRLNKLYKKSQQGRLGLQVKSSIALKLQRSMST